MQVASCSEALSEDDESQFKDDVVDMVESLIMTDSNGWRADEFVRMYGDLKLDGMIVWGELTPQTLREQTHPPSVSSS